VVCPEGKVQSGTRCINVTGGEDPTPNIPFLTFNDDESPDYNNSLFKQFGAKDTWSFDEVMEYLARWKDGDQGPRDIVEAWNDPTIEPLPNAPSLNVYCVYGVGLPTDRMFHYRHQNESDNDLPFIMDDGMQDDESENITYGIKMTNGDGSVPLMSTGYTCTELWKKGSPLNPGNARVITREYQHEGSFQPHDPMRQGPKSSEHCDILGNHAVLEDIIKVVSGGSLDNHYVSNIKEIARKVREHPFNNEKKESDKNLAGASSTSDEL
jgi:Lecithin:cholesterol acyltransferase